MKLGSVIMILRRKFSMEMDQFSMEMNQFSMEMDHFSMEMDQFSMEMDQFSVEMDQFSWSEKSTSIKVQRQGDGERVFLFWWDCASWVCTQEHYGELWIL